MPTKRQQNKHFHNQAATPELSKLQTCTYHYNTLGTPYTLQILTQGKELASPVKLSSVLLYLRGHQA